MFARNNSMCKERQLQNKLNLGPNVDRSDRIGQQAMQSKAPLIKIETNMLGI